MRWTDRKQAYRDEVLMTKKVTLIEKETFIYPKDADFHLRQG